MLNIHSGLPGFPPGIRIPYSRDRAHIQPTNSGNKGSPVAIINYTEETVVGSFW